MNLIELKTVLMNDDNDDDEQYLSVNGTIFFNLASKLTAH